MTGVTTMIWSADTAFEVHPNAKSHSGMTVTMGKEAIVSRSRKQKLDTKGFTEAELVAVNDVVFAIPWVKHFLDGQDCKTDTRIVCQDNKSTIQLEVNGHQSVRQRSQHINNQKIFIVDQVEKGIGKTAHCPTDDMCPRPHKKQNHQIQVFDTEFVWI